MNIVLWCAYLLNVILHKFIIFSGIFIRKSNKNMAFSLFIYTVYIFTFLYTSTLLCTVLYHGIHLYPFNSLCVCVCVCMLYTVHYYQ